MEIVVKLWGNLGHYLPAYRGQFSIRRSCRTGQTVRELVDEMGLPEGLDIVVAVNQAMVEGSRVLQEGDEVAVFRPVSGG